MPTSSTISHPFNHPHTLSITAPILGLLFHHFVSNNTTTFYIYNVNATLLISLHMHALWEASVNLLLLSFASLILDLLMSHKCNTTPEP
jgi:hypothetical protein